MFYQSAKTLDKNITESANLFGISKSDFLKAAIRHPSLFYRAPQTLNSNIDNTAMLFNVDRNLLIRCALQSPNIFTQQPQTLYKNITECAKRFDVDKQHFIDAALKHSNLFSRSPESLEQNISNAAKELGVNKRELLEVALRQPVIFTFSPETLVKKARIYSYYKELKGIKSTNLIDCINFRADKHLLAQVLGLLINQQTDKTFNSVYSTKYEQLKEFLNKNTGNYEFNINYNQGVTENLSEFAKILASELDNKVSFTFNIV